MDAEFKITINGEHYSTTRAVLSFNEVVDAYNQLFPQQAIAGQPSIDFKNSALADKSDGILLPLRVVVLRNGTEINVNPYHNS